MEISEQLASSKVPKRHRVAISKPQGDGPWVQAGKDIFNKLGQGTISAVIGKSGVGKTQIAANLIYSVLKNTGRSCLYVTTRDFFLDLKACYRKDASTVEREVLEDYVRPGVLVLDECDKRGETQWEDGMLEHLLNKRYGAMRDTVLIGNFTPAQFEAAMGAAIISRINETGHLALCEWPSFREGVCG